MTNLAITSRDRLALVILRAAVMLLPKLPGATVDPLVQFSGRFAWLLNREGRRAVQGNLRVVLAREPSMQEIQSVFVTAVANYVDLLRLPRLAQAGLATRVDVEGWENLSNGLAAGKGVLVASLHLGNIEAVGYAARARDLSMVIPVERIEPPEFLREMIALRERAGFRCVPVGQAAFRDIRAALSQNGVVGIGADRVTVGSGERVSFCGRPACMPVAAAALALRTGAPLLPLASRRLPHGRFHCRIGPPIPTNSAAPGRAGLIEITERLLAALEVFLRENPTQWVVFRPVWDARSK